MGAPAQYVDRLALARAERDNLLQHGMTMARIVGQLRAEWDAAKKDHSAHAAPDWSLIESALVLLDAFLARIRAEIKADIAADLFAREQGCRTTDALAEMFRVATSGPAGELIAAELERRFPDVPAEQRVFAQTGMDPAAFARACADA